MEHDEVALGEHPHRVEGGAGSGLLSAFKDPEIMRSRLNDKAAFADVAIDQKLSQKFGFFGAYGQKFVVCVVLYGYLFSSDKVECLFGRESEGGFCDGGFAVAFIFGLAGFVVGIPIFCGRSSVRLHGSAVTSLFIENKTIFTQIYPFSVVFSDHFLSSPAACRKPAAYSYNFGLNT